MNSINLLSSEHFHVINHHNKKHSLIINRTDNSISTLGYDDANELCNLSKRGHFYGIVGKFLDRFLILIKNRSYVGSLYEPSTKTEHDIYVITQVQAVDIALSSQNQPVSQSDSVKQTGTIEEKCQKGKHSTPIDPEQASSSSDQFNSLPTTISTGSYASRNAPWNPFKLQIPFGPKRPDPSPRTNTKLLDSRSETSQSSNQDDWTLVEEMIKLFNGTNSFYFSPTLDLTNRLSKESCLIKVEGTDSVWNTSDEQFFWNRYMIRDFIELSRSDNIVNFFICVILHGFISIKSVPACLNIHGNYVEKGIMASEMIVNADTQDRHMVDSIKNVETDNNKALSRQRNSDYQLALISRRSVYRAGTRYRRRGCDEDGNCANFVETEQIFRSGKHVTSVLTIRGSIPLFWYQTGLNYRPPPMFSRSDNENHNAFSKHFLKLMETYETERIVIIDCTEHSGREKPIHDAYKQHTNKFKQSYPNINLIEFDFHHHCRGRKCSDIQVAKHLKSCGVDENLLKEVKYYWNDGGIICKQDGVIRVNCLDCTDRTNVVQRSLALQVLDLQLSRLGVILPDTNPDNNECRKEMQQMWSANGNVLSTQYCGTRALLSGDKRLAGYLQDTYNSASRYYISKFRDTYRQAAIDAMLGVKSSEVPGQHSTIDGLDLVDPMISSRGGALLKDVGNRVSNRLARLKGRFYERSNDCYSVNLSGLSNSGVVDESNIQISDARIADTLDGLNIDWPSSEELRLEGNDEEDCYHDDDYCQLMLSIDLDDIKRLREDENKCTSANKSEKDLNQKIEEIDMVETCGNWKRSVSNTKESTSTTST